MIRVLFLLLFCAEASTTSAQGVWTWIKGDSIDQPYTTAIRGQLRVPSTTNLPSTIGAGGNIIYWQDKKENLWLIQMITSSTNSNYDTLIVWRYHIPSNTWIWMAGYDSFDVIGSFSVSIKADYRNSLNWHMGNGLNKLNSNRYWLDSAGNLWMINRSSLTNNIYTSRFNIESYQFEIVDYRPNNYFSLGTKFVSSSSNFPTYSVGSIYWLKGDSVYFYDGFLDSGGGVAGSRIASASQLWLYNMRTNIWTWLGGYQGYNIDSLKPNYGVKGTASVTNWAGYRSGSTVNWIRKNKLYLFGGYTIDTINSRFGISNDIWEYDINTQMWTWLQGEKFGHNPKGYYPSSYCEDNHQIYPSARGSMGSIKSILCDQVFWIYGGAINVLNGKQSSELWMYRPDDNRWIWVDGLRERSNDYWYGQKGISSIKNVSPSMSSGFVFSDSKGSIYTCGTGVAKSGSMYNWGNEIWRYDPDYSCVNYNITDKFIDRGIDKYICVGDSTVVRIRKGYDSLRITPMTNVTFRQTDSTTEIWLKPSINTSYKIIAYGYRCESYLDSLTVPIVSAPPAFGYDTVSICQGQSIHGKTTTGNYTIKIKNPLGCDSTLYLKLTVLTLPRTILDTTICEGNSVLGHTSSGTYIDTFVAGAMNGCDSIYMLKLTVVPERRLLIDTVLCRGSNIAGYTITGTYYDTFASPEGCNTYRVIKLVMNEPSSSAITKSICQGQSYGGHTTTGTFIDNFRNINGCDSIRTLTLTVNPSSGSTLDTSICLGSNIRGHSTSGTHRDTFTDRNGCDSICILRLTVRPARPIKPLRNITICPGADTIIDAGLGHRSYLWSAGESTSQIRIATPQRYILQFVDSTGCPGRDSMMLSLFNPPQVKLPDTLQNYKGEYFFLEPIISPPASAKSRYRWMPLGMFTCDTCSTVEFRPDTHLLASVIYTDERGCSATASSQILVFGKWAIGYPSAFSPNGDGQNDAYAPNITNIKSFTLEIYNRTGEKVYQYTPERPTWDGTFKGEPAPVSTYYYYSEVILLNKAIYLYKGVFHLMR